MSNRIHWQLFLRVSTEEKANRLLSRIAEVAHMKIDEMRQERYWEDRSFFCVRLMSSIAADQTAEAVLETLQTCSQLADRWMVGPPQFYEGGEWEFSGSADSSTIKVPGLTQVDFQAGNIRIGNQETDPVEEKISH